MGATSLQSIEITNAEIGDRTVESACRLSQLRKLSIPGCHRITSVDLRQLSNLESLDLARTSLAPDGLQSVGSAKRLRRIDLSQCEKLSDDVIAAAVALPKLKTVDISGSKFSIAAYKMLEEMQDRPHTRVYMESR